MMPWKATAQQGPQHDVRRPGRAQPLIIAAFGFWVIVLVLCEIFLQA